MRVGVVFVHYHTPELARRAVASAERELVAAAGDGVSGWIVVVDNGSDAAGAAVLAGTGAEVLRPPANLGYAGGVNAGAARLTEADVLLLANPDVELLPGALAALLAALARGAAVAGPRFFWDHDRRLRLPPTEPRDARSEALGLLAPRSPSWAARARRRWRRHARRHWQAAGEIGSVHLSGALLAVSRAAWDRVGPFDEGFRLYFEETDWLARLRRAGLAARYVPAAEVVHAFAKSAAGEPRAAEWFRESAALYVAKHHGKLRREVMAALARGTERRAVGAGGGWRAAYAEEGVMAQAGTVAEEPTRKTPRQERTAAWPEGRSFGVPGGGGAAAGETVRWPSAHGGSRPEDVAARPTAGPVASPADLDLSQHTSDRPLWVEVSPRPEGFPAAGEPLPAGAAAWSLPAEVRDGVAGTWWARVVDERGRELLCRPLALGNGR
jgi:GT2 family glycosyltransferase